MNDMKKTDNFYKSESLTYDHPIDAPELITSESSIEEIQYLSEIGYSLIIEKGKVTLNGGETEMAKLIADEIVNNLIDQEEYHELNDYVAYHCWSDDVLIDEVKLAVRETILQKAYNTKFIDVFEYIVDMWCLTEKQKKELRKREAEDFQERKHPDEDKHAGRKLFND